MHKARPFLEVVALFAKMTSVCISPPTNEFLLGALLHYALLVNGVSESVVFKAFLTIRDEDYFLFS